MGVREDSLNMLREGSTPAQIAKSMGVSIKTTLGYLDQLVGRGSLRRSDIFFSIPKKVRANILKTLDEEALPEPQYISGVMNKKGLYVDPEDVMVVIEYGDARHARGDMYEDITTIETHLHGLIRSALEEEYGKGESRWWRKGIEIGVRKACQGRREDDDEPVKDPYCYTEFIDLWKILDTQWNVLCKSLPRKVAANKPALKADMIRLNGIRNRVMHPVKGVVPSEEDFEFVRRFKDVITEDVAES